MSLELVKPEFKTGSEKRFYEFMSKLNDKNKIAIISHTDLDGIAAAKVVNKVVNADYLMLREYSEINQHLIDDLKSKKVKFAIFTDINITDKEIVDKISKFAEVLIIDHHRLDADYNTEKVVYLNSQGFSAGYICYYLFSKIQNVEEYDWLVACSCISDWLAAKPAFWLGKVLDKYDDKLVIDGDGVRKSGKFWDLQYDISLILIYLREKIEEAYRLIEGGFNNSDTIAKYSLPVRDELNELISDFQSKKIEIHDGYYLEVKSKFKVLEILINELSSKEHNKTFIFAYDEDNLIKISARRQDGSVNLPELMKKLTSGFENSNSGGHIKAAGALFPAEYLPEFKKRLEII